MVVAGLGSVFMKMFFAALALLVACGSSARAADCKSIADAQARLACFDKAPPPAPAKKPAASTKAASSVDPFAVAKAALLRKLTDPGSAQWMDLYKVASPSGELVCGMVNAKNRMGGYNGATAFVYIPAMSQAVLMFNGVADPEPAEAGLRNYCIYCADNPRADPKVRPHCVNYPH